jgi:hypothetical protein
VYAVSAASVRGDGGDGHPLRRIPHSSGRDEQRELGLARSPSERHRISRLDNTASSSGSEQTIIAIIAAPRDRERRQPRFAALAPKLAAPGHIDK